MSLKVPGRHSSQLVRAVELPSAKVPAMGRHIRKRKGRSATQIHTDALFCCSDLCIRMQDITIPQYILPHTCTCTQPNICVQEHTHTHTHTLTHICTHVPGPHGSHWILPSSRWNVPAGQAWHCDTPVVRLLNRPLGHRSHTDWPGDD